MEPLGRPDDRVAVAHPYGLLTVDPTEQPVVAGDRDVRGAVFAFGGGDDVPTQIARHEVQPVANAEDGDLSRPQARVRARRTFVVDRGRTAREDDGLGIAAGDLCPRRVVRDELRVDVQLPDPPSDELGVLAAEVQDEHGIGLGDGGMVGRGPRGCRGLERGLEVGLDLGVVRGQHAVTRVGRVAVDRLAALRRLVRRRVRV